MKCSQSHIGIRGVEVENLDPGLPYANPHFPCPGLAFLQRT